MEHDWCGAGGNGKGRPDPGVERARNIVGVRIASPGRVAVVTKATSLDGVEEAPRCLPPPPAQSNIFPIFFSHSGWKGGVLAKYVEMRPRSVSHLEVDDVVLLEGTKHLDLAQGRLANDLIVVALLRDVTVVHAMASALVGGRGGAGKRGLRGASRR